MNRFKTWWHKTDYEGMTNGDNVTWLILEIVILVPWAVAFAYYTTH